MIPAWWALKALPWIKGNWQYMALGGCAVFCALWLRGCGQLTACQAASGKQALELTQATQQKQELEGKLETASKAKAKVVYEHVPGKPCPDVHVEVEADGGSVASGKGSQAQDASQTAKVVPAPSTPKNGLWTGAGYFNGAYFVTLGVEVDRWRVDVVADKDFSVGGQAAYRVLNW